MTMAESPQPDIRWAPLESKPKNRRRLWLIVGLAIAALAIVGALLFFLLPRGDAPTPDASASPSPSSSPTGSATPDPSASPEASPDPDSSEPPANTPPVPADPTIETFRSQVSGWITDAPRGLDIIAGSSGQDGLAVLDTLEQDAQRLSDALPPSSIDPQWRDGVSAYAQRLAELRGAISSGSGVSGAVDAARSAVQNLAAVVGL
ncbi:hypothetical protein [Microbacterium sp. 179-I 3D4 NHS]|uniref:hypothetical protein n=1 Tax=Microbacterium sp. 179-I 3D4 NHS TaxID=3142381 RepID=UPI0039A1FC64